MMNNDVIIFQDKMGKKQLEITNKDTINIIDSKYIKKDGVEDGENKATDTIK